MKVVLAFSGGLDTSFCVPWLRETHDAEVITVTVDTGGISPSDRQRLVQRSRELGAGEHHLVDARESVYDHFVSTLIRGNVLRGSVYPLSVAAERTQQAIELVKVAQAVGADAIAHGSTGAGNDQIRFDVALQVLWPEGRLITPIRELGMTREQSMRYLEERGFAIPTGADRYSVNRGLWGTTIGGEWTHDSWQAPPEDAWVPLGVLGDLPQEEITIDWEDGLPVALDAEPLRGIAMIEALARKTRPRGIGIGIHTGETTLGIKGRIGFEAGPAVVLIDAHRELEKITLTHWQSFWKDHMASFFGDRLHQGHAFDPVMEDIEAMIRQSQRRVIGRTRVVLGPGRHFAVVGVESPCSLMRPDAALYGEENQWWTGAEAAAFAKVSAIPAKLSRTAGSKTRTAVP